MKIMNNIKINYLAITTLCASLATILGAIDASAHGYVSSPKSRIIMCKENGIDNPTLPACIAAKEAGNVGFYTPHDVSIYGAKDDHQQLIPDGKLCSAGRYGYQGLDLARNDWPSTLVHVGLHEFVWTNTAATRTKYIRFYITKAGFNPGAAPLTWSDLELIYDSGPAGQVQSSTHLVNLPQRTGRHIVYSIWQRDWQTDAAEAHYQCVDVEFDSQPRSSSPSSASSFSSSSSSSPSNNPPIASLTTSVSYERCGSVSGIASAQGSTDPDGDTLNYAWEITNTNSNYIDRRTGETVSFNMRPVTNYTAKLIVTDGKGGTATASKNLYHSYSDDCTRSSSSSNPSSVSSSSRSSSSAPTKASCSYVVNSQWSNGFTAAIRIKNTSTQTINGWSVNWQYADTSKVTGSWNADLSGTNPYTAKNQGWNANIQPGQTVEVGLQGTKPASAAIVPVVSGGVCQ